MVWKRKRSGSSKKEDIYFSTVGEGKLQASQPNKPEPIYTEMSDKHNNAKNISIKNATKESVTMQNNPAYSNPNKQVVLQDNPAYSDVVSEHIKLQDNPAYGSASKKLKTWWFHYAYADNAFFYF